MQNILFVELLGGIGDVLIALAAIQALARSHSEAKLTVLTFAPGGELLEHDPLIHQVMYAEKGKVQPTIASLLNQQSFDLIVSDTNYENIDQLIQASGAPHVVTNLWRSPPPNEFVSDRFLKILLAEGLIQPEAIAPAQLKLTASEQQQARAALAQLPRPIVVLYPDAGMAIKQWSFDHLIHFGQKLQAELGGTILVPIGASVEQAEQVAGAIGNYAKVWQRGTLRQFAAMVALTDLFVAPDTGPARIAAASGVPTITLFGPSWHERYGQPTPHVNLQGYPKCPERIIENFTVQACWYGGKCPIADWQTCVDEISPNDVLLAAKQILGVHQ
jgi:ADP-heptose:LPS heptosyltransferase